MPDADDGTRLPLPDPAAELRGLLRETIEVARDAAHALDDNAAVLAIVKAYLGVLTAEEKRKNDLVERQLALDEKKQVTEEQRRHDSSDERRSRAGERSKWQTTLFETAQKAGEGACKILDSRWSSISLIALFLLQLLWWSLGWLPGDHPPLPEFSVPSAADPIATPDPDPHYDPATRPSSEHP